MNGDQQERFEEARIEQMKAHTGAERAKALMYCAIGVAALLLGFAAVIP